MFAERDEQKERLCETIVELEQTRHRLAAKEDEARELSDALRMTREAFEETGSKLAAATSRISHLEHVEKELTAAEKTIEEFASARDKAIKAFEHNKNRLDVCWADLDKKKEEIKALQRDLAEAREESAASRHAAQQAATKLHFTEKDLSISKSEVSVADAELDTKVKELALTRTRERETELARQAAEDAKFVLQTRLFPLRKAATFLRDSLKYGEAAAIKGIDKWHSLTPSSSSAAAAVPGAMSNVYHQDVAGGQLTGEEEHEAIGLFQEIEQLLRMRADGTTPSSAPGHDGSKARDECGSGGASPAAPAVYYSPKAVRGRISPSTSMDT